jgi:hypothetical protein
MSTEPDPTERRVRNALHELAGTVTGEPITAPPTQLDREHDDRSAWTPARWGMVAAIAALVIAAGALIAGRGNDDQVQSANPSSTAPDTSPTGTGSTLAPSTTVPPRWSDQIAPDSTLALPPAPIEARSTPVMVWTGTEVIVWGGMSPTADGNITAHGDGATFDPATGTWRRIAPSLLSPRYGAIGAWTGQEMIVWGGYNGADFYSDGAAYDPATDTWRPLPASPLVATGGVAGEWTGTELVVLAGSTGADQYTTASAAYTPATDTWRAMPNIDGELGGSQFTTWTGRAVLAVIVMPADGAGVTRTALYQLVPAASDDWAPEVESLDTNGLIGTPGAEPVGALSLLPDNGPAFDSFDPLGARVAIGMLSPAGAAPAGNGATSVWTGIEVLWLSTAGGAFDPATGAWRTFTIPDAFTTSMQPPALVWADGVAIAWGRFEIDGGMRVVDDGFAYRPPGLGEPAVTTIPISLVPSTAVPGTSLQPPPATAPDGPAPLASFDDFSYYGACGNEPVDVHGTTYYPLFPEELAALDQSRYRSDDAGAPAGFARVAPPGPGDDIGTIVLFSDGIARFESDSGRVIWLSVEEHTYNWVC